MEESGEYICSSWERSYLAESSWQRGHRIVGDVIGRVKCPWYVNAISCGRFTRLTQIRIDSESAAAPLDLVGEMARRAEKD